MINRLKFNHFRCFKDFALDHLAQLTIISGRNNSGKTTILEGIYLLFSFQRGDVLFNIDGFRGIDFQPQIINGNVNTLLEPLKLWETLFHNMDANIPMQISLYFSDSSCKKITLSQDKSSSLSTVPAFDTIRPITNSNLQHNMLKFNYLEDDNEVAFGHFIINGISLAQQVDKKSEIDMPFVAYFGPNILISQQTVAEWLGVVERKNRKGILIQCLRELINDINDIFIVTNRTGNDVFCRLKNGNSLPIRVMGDGINKLLNYITAIIANPKAIFLIDEIENGFHYSFYPKLWKMLSEVSIENDSQIIFTSHSSECIESASRNITLPDNNLFSYIRIDGKNNDISYVAYNRTDLAFSLSNGMEVR